MAAGQLGNKMKVIGVIQARMNSERLPGKIFANVNGEESLLALIWRRISGVEIEWWLATTNSPADDVTEIWGRSNGLKVFRGNEDDVLSRFSAIVSKSKCDWVVRVTADNPLVDSFGILELISQACDAPRNTDVIGDKLAERHFPLGYIPEIVRADALIRIDKELSPDVSYHRSNVTSAFYPEKSQQFLNNELPKRSEWRWTIDTNLDLLMVRELFRRIGYGRTSPNYLELVQFLDSNEQIAKINQSVIQKEIEEG